MRGRTAPGRGGFTLVEVLATLLLVSIVLPVAMQGISLALRASDYARRSIEAAQLADAKLSELIATNQWMGGAAGGEFGEEWPDYRWAARATERDVGLTQIGVRVSWTSRDLERSVEVTTLIYRGATQQ